ncbi:erythromycin esterase family protein [Pseudomonas sp. Marseille-QA0892]
MTTPAKGVMPRFNRPRGDGPAADLSTLLRQHAEPLPDMDSDAFGALFDRYADAKVVLIGESSHGTAEFYRARAAITRRLVERHGFNIVAAEADWPDAAQVDRCVRDLGPSASTDQAFARFPTWMWRNTEVQAFAHWLRNHNRALPLEARVEFRGLDIYSLRSSIREVLRYLDEIDPALARDARARYACLTPWQEDPALYGHFVERGSERSCEAGVLEQLNTLLEKRLECCVADDERFFQATQNARVVRSAEQYYRAMYRGSAASWNLRDRHMFDTLQALLAQRGPAAKAVVWAHNSHIGNAAATSMGWDGEFNIGELCRTAYGDEAVLIGMSTDRGEVTAADDWDGKTRTKTVLPSRADSWEQQFLGAGLPASLTCWRDPSRAALRDALAEPRLERAIGVIYRPQTERYSHYFEAVLSEQFDAMLWFEETHALTPLPAPTSNSREGDTFPFGV